LTFKITDTVDTGAHILTRRGLTFIYFSFTLIACPAIGTITEELCSKRHTGAAIHAGIGITSRWRNFALISTVPRNTLTSIIAIFLVDTGALVYTREAGARENFSLTLTASEM
jgi:uncharacterized protein YqgC (DUF456 family)